MQYSDTTNKLGLIQSCEVKLFGDNGYTQISGNSDRLKQFTARINRAQDRFCFLAMSADGQWQYDDDNNTDFGIATTNLAANQRDYTFAVTHLEIEKVLVKSASSGDWVLIDPMDQDDPDYGPDYLENNTGTTGRPYKYDKRGNSLILYPTPSYSSTGGLKIYFKRGPSYFVSTDTTKVPGFASIFHDYLALHASANYAIENTMPKGKNLYELLQQEEKAITKFYSRREKDMRKIMRPKKINYI